MEEQFKAELKELLEKYNAILEVDEEGYEPRIKAFLQNGEEIHIGYSFGEFK